MLNTKVTRAVRSAELKDERRGQVLLRFADKLVEVKMKTELYSAILLFVIATSAGLVAGKTSKGGSLWIAAKSTKTKARRPATASTKRETDLARLSGAELLTATQDRVISAARIENRNDEIGIVLGHFATRSEDGSRQLACDSTYNRISLHFFADGMADAGEKPSMRIDAPCRSSVQDLSSIDAILIPYEKLLQEKPANMDLTIDDVKFTFAEMMPEWPRHWALQSVRLYNSEEKSREMLISNREIRQIRGSALMIHFQDTARIPAESKRH